MFQGGSDGIALQKLSICCYLVMISFCEFDYPIQQSIELLVHGNGKLVSVAKGLCYGWNEANWSIQESIS